jgi:FLYWCH zinc finger domain
MIIELSLSDFATKTPALINIRARKRLAAVQSITNCKEMSTFSISKTQKNKPLLLCNGFSYTIDKSGNEKTYWKCEDARTLKCKGRIHTDESNSVILHETNNHNHPGSAVSSEIRLFEEKIRDRAANHTENTQAIIDHCLTTLSDQAVARLPELKHIKRNIQHARIKNDLPKIPQDRTFAQIPGKLMVNKRNSTFLQFDSSSGEDRLLIFSSNDQLELLGNGEELLVDGTFKVSFFFRLVFLLQQFHLIRLHPPFSIKSMLCMSFIATLLFRWFLHCYRTKLRRRINGLLTNC